MHEFIGKEVVVRPEEAQNGGVGRTKKTEIKREVNISEF